MSVLWSRTRCANNIGGLAIMPFRKITFPKVHPEYLMRGPYGNPPRKHTGHVVGGNFFKKYVTRPDLFNTGRLRPVKPPVKQPRFYLK